MVSRSLLQTSRFQIVWGQHEGSGRSVSINSSCIPSSSCNAWQRPLLHSDHLRKSRWRHFKSRRWTFTAVYFVLLDWSVINSFIVHKSEHLETINWNAKNILLHQLLKHCISCDTIPATVSCSIVPQGDLQRNRLDLRLGHFVRWSKRRGSCANLLCATKSKWITTYCS